MSRADISGSTHPEEQTRNDSGSGISLPLSREWNELKSMPLKARTKNKRAEFLKRFPEVETWYKTSCQGSKETGRLQLCNLGNFCAWADLLPAQMVHMEEEELHPILRRFIDHEIGRSMTGATVSKRISAIRSWLRWNGRKIIRPLKIPDAGASPTLDDKKVCGQKGLRQILEHCHNPKVRACILLISHAGLRMSVLGNSDGTSGMTLSQLSELDIENLEFKQTPSRIDVPRELSKNSRPHITFLSSEGCSAVSVYLKQRRADGEELSPDSPLIHTTSTRNDNRFITRNSITTPIRTAIRLAGHNMRPYDLRHYFQSRMQIAETRGLVPRAMHRSWMGHMVDMAARYGIARSNLDDDLLAESRIAYSRCQHLLVSQGLDDDPPEAPMSESAPESNTPSQKAIRLDEVKEHLDQGWVYVATLPNNLCIVSQM